MEGKNFFSRALENAFKKPDRERTAKEYFKALSKDEIELNFRISRFPLPAYREHLLINCAQKKLSLNALKYVELTSPESAPPLALIEEVKLLIKTRTVDNALRLLALTPNIYGQATNLLQKTLLREQGYLAHAPNAEVEQKMLGEAFWKVFDGESGELAYQNRCWRSMERRYVNWLRQSSLLDIDAYEKKIQTEARSGSMPSRVREYISLTLPDTYSDETRLALLQAPIEVTVPDSALSSNYGEFSKSKQLVQLEKEVGAEKKIADLKVSALENLGQRRNDVLKTALYGLRKGWYSVDEIRSVPELASLISEKNITELTKNTTAHLEHIKEVIEADSTIDHAKILKIIQQISFKNNFSFSIVREVLLLCGQKPHFFDGLDVEKWTGILVETVPNRYCRSFVTDTITHLFDAGNLTPEIAQIFLFRYDDDLLADLWERVQHDPRYASVFLGRVADPAKRDRLKQDVPTKVVDILALEKILATADNYYETAQKISSLERHLRYYEKIGRYKISDTSRARNDSYNSDCQRYIEMVRSHEKINAYLAQHTDDIRALLDQKLSVFYNRRFEFDGLFTINSSKLLSDVAIFSVSTDDKVAENILGMIEFQLNHLPTPQQPDNRYEKLLTALIVRGSPEQQTLVAKKMSDYMGLYGLDRGAISIIKAWRAGFSDPERIPDLYFSVAENLRVMRSVENKFPGGCKILFEEFGIKNFARYGEKILLKQLEEKDDISKPYGVILFPEDDWNGAFSEDRDLFEKLSEQLSKKGIRLRITEAKNGLRAAAQTEKMMEKYGQASFCLVGGHGTEDGLALGSRSAKKALPTISRTDLKNKRVRRSGAFLKDGSQIILISCSTGKDGGFAQKLSEAFGRAIEVTGPDVPTNIKSIKLISTDPIRFEVEYADPDTVRQYVAGVKS